MQCYNPPPPLLTTILVVYSIHYTSYSTSSPSPSRAASSHGCSAKHNALASPVHIETGVLREHPHLTRLQHRQYLRLLPRRPAGRAHAIPTEIVASACRATAVSFSTAFAAAFRPAPSTAARCRGALHAPHDLDLHRDTCHINGARVSYPSPSPTSHASMHHTTHTHMLPRSLPWAWQPRHTCAPGSS